MIYPPSRLMPTTSYEEKMVLAGGESMHFYGDGLVEAYYPQYETFGFPRRLRRVAGGDL